MAVLNGTSGNDELFGFSNADTISGFEGNDQIFGNGGNDSILAGVGDDLVYGNEGNDTISAGSGNDTLSGGMGNDILTGGLGTDTAIFEGNQNNFNLTLDVSGLLKVTDLNVTDGDEGADTLDGIEAVKFVDGSWQVIRGEFLVNTTTIDSQQNPAMTALADGGFVVTWQSNLQDGSGYGIYGQRYNNAGVAVGSEFRVNTTTADAQTKPTIAGLVDGGFVVTWQSQSQSQSQFQSFQVSGIWGQRYNNAGVAVGSEFYRTSLAYNAEPRIAALADGGFVMAWFGVDADSDSYGVTGQRYNNSGQAASTFLINTYTLSQQMRPAITGLSDGGFVVTWQSATQDTISDTNGVYGQRYSDSGAKIGNEFRINTTTQNAQDTPAITGLSDGGFVATWQSADDSGYGIWGQRYNSSGAVVGDEFRVNATTFNAQVSPVITALSDGGFVVAWQSFGQDGVGDGIFVQRFNANGQPISHTIVGFNQADTFDLVSSTGVVLLAGGAGNDLYKVGALEMVSELTNEGIDTVETSVSYGLSINVEDLILTGVGVIDGYGNSLNNIITGNTANNILDGGSGDDTVSGGDGDDNIRGGFGNDVLSGGTGTDILIGGSAGNDLLQGGTGSDTYIFGTAFGQDTLDDTSTTAELNTIDLSAYNASQLTFTSIGDDYVITITGTSDQIILKNVLNAAHVSTYQLVLATETLTQAQFFPLLVNSAPEVLNPIGDLSVGLESFSYQLSSDAFFDIDGDILTYSATLADGSTLPSWLVFDAQTQTFSGTATDNDARIWQIKVIASDGQLSAEQTFYIDTSIENRQPFISVPLENQTTNEGQAFSYSLPVDAFIDLDGDALTYSATLADGSSLPSWLVFDGTTQTFSGTPSFDDSAVLSVTVFANDGQLSASQTFELLVSETNQLHLTPLDNQTAAEGQLFSFQLPSDSFYDDNGSVFTYSATLADGSELPSWLTFDAATQTFSGTPSYDDAGVYSLKVSIGEFSAEQVFNFTIDNINRAPTGNSTAILANGQENTAYTVTTAQLLQGFTDIDSGDVLSVMNLSTNNGTIVDNGNGTLTITPTANYNGSVSLSYQVTDGNGGLVDATQSFNLIKAVNVDTVGTTGGDMLHGGSGDDTYIVNHVRDVVIEADTNGGIDTVQSSLSHNLANNVENLVLVGSINLSGIGNNLDNSLEGNNGNNRLLAGFGNDTLSGGAGGDTLNGGAGADIMFGGTGNDTFTVENSSDVVTELADEGFDTVNSFITYTLTANVERLNLENAGGQINGFGNALDNTLTGNNFANWLVGGAGNDTLQGKGGADSLEGGLGDDLYYVDNAGDMVTELANEGTDKVSSLVSYTLTTHVEQLFLTGIAGLSGVGNAQNNIIYGNSGNNQLSGDAGNDSLNGGAGDDILEGGAGNDTLVGGFGNDSYLFDVGLGRDVIDNKDSIGNDMLLLGAGISAEQIWLRQTGNDLEVSVIGTASSVKVKGWYGADEASKIDSVQLADGNTLLVSEVQTLVDAMAAFTPPPLGQTSLNTTQQNALGAVITASW